MTWIAAIVAGAAATVQTGAAVASSEAQKNQAREGEEANQALIREQRESSAARGFNPNTIQASIASTQQRGPQATLQLGQLRSQQPGASRLGGPAQVQPVQQVPGQVGNVQVQPAQPARPIQPAELGQVRR